MKELKLISKCKHQLKNLCTASFVRLSSTETEQTSKRLTYEKVELVIEERKKEFEYFSGVKKQLCDLCHHLKVKNKKINGKMKLS